MKQGFVKVAAATPNVKVADVEHNKQEICRLIDETVANGAKIVVFPELCLTGYTCGDLFAQDILIKKTESALKEIISHTEDKDALVFVGLPYIVLNKLYNVAAVINRGELLGFVTKSYLPNFGEAYEMRQFQPGPEKADWIEYEEDEVAFGPQILFQCKEMPNLIVSAEICEDAWAMQPPSVEAARRGATLIVNCSASSEAVGKDEYRRALIQGQSARLIAGYVYANAGEGESTTDVVYGGHNIIAENGVVLNESARFQNETIYSEIDIDRLVSERCKTTTFKTVEEYYATNVFSLNVEETNLTRTVEKLPFIPVFNQNDVKYCENRYEEILTIQALGLKKRLAHANCKSAVIGISGGLDSTLALIVTAKAFDMLGIERSNIEAVTMPCFGTTDRTYQNACKMTQMMGATLREVNIKDAVRTHFRDIGQPEDKHDVTFENAQARERTQVLMDIANMTGGMVIGTGDMSELALGWATYNGDHMSMYGVNASIPKTLVRRLVEYYADKCGVENPALRDVFWSVIDTPVSPELLPPKDSEIAQKTEDLVGPYELHDFFLYYVLRFGYAPSKVYRLAKYAFAGEYDDETIMKWLKKFYWRFFTQQFKRSCLPDGPKVGSVGLSPRGDLRMPSDACVTVWIEDLEKIQ